MAHAVYLCLKYFGRRRIAFFGVAAVALCVALLVVITSLFTGFIDAYERHARELLGEVVLQPPARLGQWETLAGTLEENPAVTRAEPMVQAGALLYLRRGDVRGVTVSGVNLARQAADGAFGEGLVWPAGAEDGAFELTGAAREQARAWLRQRLGREPREAEMPVPAVVGIGILARPDELTDQYNREAIAEALAQWSEPMVVTTAREGALTDREDLGPGAGRARRTSWPVAAVQTGMHLPDTTFVYWPLEAVRDLVGEAGPEGMRSRGLVRIEGAPGLATPEVMAAVRQAWRTYAAQELGWPADRAGDAMVYAPLEQAGIRIFLQEIRKQLQVMQLLLGLICSVAALLIFVILFMVVTDKRRDIGILRSVGASRGSVAAIFLLYGLGIGSIGAGLGVLLGWWATRNIALIEAVFARVLGFKIWRSGVYLFSRIPDEVDWSSVDWIVLAGILAAVLGALLPALRAARWQPVRALRWE